MAGMQYAEGPAVIDWPVLNIPGYTGNKQRMFLRALCACLSPAAYLEIGVFHGGSLIAAAQDNPGIYVGIDNFKEGSRAECLANVSRYAAHATVLEGDVYAGFVWDRLRGQTFNTLFTDANVSTDAGPNIARYLSEVLASEFIWIVDNWSEPQVRADYYAALVRMGWSELGMINTDTVADCDIKGWWSGWHIAVVQKQPLNYTPWHVIAPQAPPLWDVQARRVQELFSITDYKVKGL